MAKAQLAFEKEKERKRHGRLLSQHLLVLSRAKTSLHAREAKQKAIRKSLCGGDFLIKFNLLPFPGSKQERATTREPDKTGETITQEDKKIPALRRTCCQLSCSPACMCVCVSLGACTYMCMHVCVCSFSTSACLPCICVSEMRGRVTCYGLPLSNIFSILKVCEQA